jgi:3-dehydrotetronate 4-kinase
MRLCPGVVGRGRFAGDRWVGGDPGRPVAITTTASRDAVAALQKRHGVSAAAERPEAILAGLAVRLVGEAGVRRLLVAGGETSGAVVQALGFDRLAVGAYLGPDLNRLVTPGAAADRDRAQVRKAGACRYHMLEAMRRPQASPAAAAPWPPSSPAPAASSVRT